MELNTLITPFQREVAVAFFELPESAGFVLAGGAALIATGVVRRQTDDLDFFAARGDVHVPSTKRAFLAMCSGRSWATEIVRDSAEFVRLDVVGPDGSLAVDFGIDATLLLPPTVTFLGPTVAPEENAGRKTLALFGRWRPRDFVDVFYLARRFGKSHLLELAAERDQGFDLWVFAQAMHQVGAFPVGEFPIEEAEREAMIRFFNLWAEELRAQTQS